MRALKLMLFMLTCVVTVSMKGQYNPSNPAEPGVVTYALNLEAYPKEAGSFNLNETTSYSEGNKVNIRTYSNRGFRFVAWEQDGDIISSSSSFTYTMPNKNVKLTAHYTYDPSNPSEPVLPDIPKYSVLELISSPSDGGFFNVSSGNKYEVGTSVQLRAYTNSYYTFCNWTESGEIISTSEYLQYELKDGNHTLVANFDYTPSNPSEPQENVFNRKLYLDCNPSEGGYFNISSGNKYESGTSVYLSAYSHQYYTFLNWTIGDSVISENSSFNFLMPDVDVNLTANYSYKYSPSNPSEPSQNISDKVNLYGMTENGVRGQTINYPIFVENNTDIIGIVVDVNFPQGFKVNTTGISLSGRVPDHNLDIIVLDDNNYRFKLLGETHITGNNGKIFDIPVTVPDTATMGNNYPVILTHGVMYAIDGGQTPISVKNGNLYVEKISEDGLYARFSYDKLHNRVKFTNQSSEKTHSYTWDFGDGTISSDMNPIHIYTDPGFYDVKLTVKGEYDEDIAEMTVYINEENSWTTEGAFYLSDTESGVRYFKSEENLISFISSSIMTGNIKIYIQADMVFQYPVNSNETDINFTQLRQLQEKLDEKSYTLSFIKNGIGKNPEFTFGIQGAQNDTILVDFFAELGRNMTCDSVDIKLGSAMFEDLYVSKSLSLELSKSHIDEDSGDEIAIRLNRSRMWAATETFIITTTQDNRISVPYEVTIPANQSGVVFFFKITDNDTLDNDSVIVFTAEGRGYPTVQTQLIIDDNEYPDLKVTASKDEIIEGESFQLTITTSRISSKPIIVNISNDNTRQFKYQQQVIIPAGEKSITTEVISVENDVIELQDFITFRVTAERYNSGGCVIIFKDNDMPTFTFTLSSDIVSESDAYVALLGVIKRTDNLDKRVTFKLSDDSNSELTYASQTIVMAKNQTEAQFNIGVSDNDMVDGDRIVNVTAAIYVSSCDCSVPDDTKGSITATIKIIDDDGPTLKIKSSGTSILEGSNGNVFTISHNVASDTDIKVTISSDKDDLLEYDRELIIPAGQTSATLLVNAYNNNQEHDSEIACLKVEAEKFAMGSCWFMITDQTLPDAVVSLYSEKTEVDAEQSVMLRIIIKNIGNSTLSSNTPVEISFSGTNKNIELKTDNPIAVGDSAVIDYKYTIPSIIGNHTFEAIVNATGLIPELLYANNNSEKVPISIVSPFSITAKADKKIYAQGESICISGIATGLIKKNTNIEVYVINDNARQTINVETDETGYFSTTWKPLNKQSGHFVIGACYPGSKETKEMDSFDVYGIKAIRDYNSCEIGLGDSYSGKITIANPGNLKQTGVTVNKLDISTNCDFSFVSPNEIEAGETVDVLFTINTNGVTDGKDWQIMPIEIATAEGSKIDYKLYYYVYPQKAKLQASKTSFNTTMSYGTPREYPIVIRNIGKSESGPITMALPEWIQTSTAREISSLAQGDSTTVILKFMPYDKMKINVKIEGQIGFNCANGDGTAIAFNITPVSEQTGILKVDVVDEYSFFTEEAPHVSNAKVMIKNPSTNKVITEGVTAEDGTFSVEIPEGWYIMSVEADNHDSFSSTIIVDPGVENNQEVFLKFQAISYSWNVEETEIDDEYQIETIVKYETRVPKPVVIITLPEENPYPYSIIPVIITNHGLIKAVDVDLSLSINNEYRFEFLNEPSLDELQPEQSHVFYAKMVPIDTDENTYKSSRRSNGNNNCYTLIAKVLYHELCKKYTGTELVEAIRKYGNRKCYSSGGGGYNGSGSSSSGSGSSSSGSGSSTSHPNRPSSQGGGKYYGDYYIINDLDNPAKFCDNNPNNNNQNGDSGSGSNNDTGNSPGNGSSNENNPPFVPEIKPDENPDCDDIPVLNYVLISNDGKRLKMRGVAADGVSQVMIVFDKGCKIPSEKCEWTCSWSILGNDVNNKYGKLENENSWDKVIYIAPEDYPDETSNEMTIKVQISYTNGEKTFYKTVDIVITRVPLILIHGLHDSYKCWFDFRNMLVGSNMYSTYQVICANYEKTNCASFKQNERVVTERIDYIIDLYKRQRIIASKADLIGHSMGGILSRLHVQEHNNQNVHKLITVNTPHSGSQWGDIVKQSLGIRALIKITQGIVGFDTPAIYDLGVNSDAIDNYLNKESNLEKMDNIPIHSVTTEVQNGEQILSDLYELKSFATEEAVRILGTRFLGPEAGRWLSIIQHAKNLGFGFEIDDAIKSSDLVVPMNSQSGGLSGSHTWNLLGSFEDAFHCFSPKNRSLWEHLVDLLGSKTESSYFSMSGFAPEDISINTISWAPRRAIERKTTSYLSPNINALIDGDSIRVYLETGGETENRSVLVSFSDNCYISHETTFKCEIPANHYGNIYVYGLVKDDNDSILIDSTSVFVDSPRAIPLELQTSGYIYIDTKSSMLEKIKCIWNDGTESFVLPDKVISSKGLVKFKEDSLIAVKTGNDTITFSFKGLTCTCPITIYGTYDSYNDVDEDSDRSSSICSTVTLSFKQKNVITRQAFRGTFTVNNGSETTSMKDLKMNLEVRDMDGYLTTSHEFQINTESLTGFEGNLDLNSGWVLEKGETGVATILFIPTKFAAPTKPKDYSFGGSFSYTDPYTGLTVTRDLNPVILTVNPSPELDLTYFIQRDVYADDPLTDEINEPTIPAEFALIINNKGFGEAKNLRMYIPQPNIIDNEKDLSVDFQIISSQINGGDVSLSFGKTVANDFGTIAAHSQMYAQWWLTSPILGHFIEYDVDATHVTSYGNEDLSLLDNVSIHELIHGFTVSSGKDKPQRGFLVNDIADAQDLPDEIYFTDATHQRVYLANSSSLEKQNEQEYVLTVNVNKAGWNYGSTLDPTNGKQKLIRIVCSDGKEVNIDNIWQTDRTLLDGKDWLYENRLHFISEMPVNEEIFYLTFEPKPDVQLEVERYDGLPQENQVLKEQLTELTVQFNKPIKAESFTTDDIMIRCQGVTQDASLIDIEKINDLEYKLKLNDITILDGYYVLTIQTEGIQDIEGFNGSNGKSATWIQFVDGKVTLIVTSSPDIGGKVTPVNERYDYDSDVTLKAVPTDGYDFIGWKSADGDMVSSEQNYTLHLVTDTEIKAIFAIKHYNFNISYNPEQGVVEGASPGIYDYGTPIKLSAIPKPGYQFDTWVLDEEYDKENNPCYITITRDIDITVLFKESIIDGIINVFDKTEFDVIISPIPLDENMYISGDFKEIHYVNIYDMYGIKCIESRNINPNQGIYTGILKPGVYLLQISTEKGLFNMKVIKK